MPWRGEVPQGMNLDVFLDPVTFCMRLLDKSTEISIKKTDFEGCWKNPISLTENL